jgi:hypothetical protein
MIDIRSMKESCDDSEYNPFDVDKLQLYNPIYQRFFDMNESNSQTIALNHPYHIHDATHVVSIKTGEPIEKDVFIKYSPLLDPYRYMIGKYNLEDESIRAMPQLNSTPDEVHPKMLSVHNTSYVDAFFTYLSSVLYNDRKMENAIDFYGSYLGVQKTFRFDVTDDMEYLETSDFFNRHNGALFYVEDPNEDDEHSINGGSRKHRRQLCFEDDSQIVLDDFMQLDENAFTEGSHCDNDDEIETIYSKSSKGSLSSNSDSSDSSDSSELNYSSSEDGDDSEGGEDSESGEDLSDCSSEESIEDIFAYVHNFPVQMICMEKCTGTLDDLFENDEMDEENGCSALFQIIMTLLTYQRAFQFTHNDLHTNNIMYVTTEKEFLYYDFEDTIYKVPTYGKIYKIIDFGRSIYKYDDRVFCSDSFGPGGDASTQYNCEPFFNENKPRLEPNNAFDLCRLGTSIFDFMMDIDDKYDDLDELQKIIYEWCMDDNGKNVLYRKNGEERYPSFKLYKMIARTVHTHTPEAQLTKPFFAKYECKDDITDVSVFSVCSN